MKRRRLLLIPLVLLGVLGIVGVVAWLFLPARALVTPARVERVTPGMTEAEVVAIFGGPPGDFTNGHGIAIDPSLDPDSGVTLQVWTTPAGGAWVAFDPQGRVVWAQFVMVTLADGAPWFARIRAWLG